MKYQDQANNNNNNNNLNDPTVAIDPQSLVEFDDLPISSEQEERVKGGATTASFNPGVLAVVGDTDPQKLEIKMTDVLVTSFQTGGSAHE